MDDPVHLVALLARELLAIAFGGLDGLLAFAYVGPPAVVVREATAGGAVRAGD